MKKLLGLLVACGLALNSTAAAAEQKIGYVDMQKALTSSKAGQDAQKKYEVQLKKAQTGIDGKKAEFEKQRESFAKQKDSLNAKTLADRQEQLINMEKELKRSFEDSQGELRRENSRLVGELVNKLRTVVAAYGKENGFTVILEKNGPVVLYADSDIEITDEIVSRFDSAK